MTLPSLPRNRAAQIVSVAGLLLAGSLALTGCTDGNTEDGNSGQDTPTAAPTDDAE